MPTILMFKPFLLQLYVYYQVLFNVLNFDYLEEADINAVDVIITSIVTAYIDLFSGEAMTYYMHMAQRHLVKLLQLHNSPKSTSQERVEAGHIPRKQNHRLTMKGGCGTHKIQATHEKIIIGNRAPSLPLHSFLSSGHSLPLTTFCLIFSSVFICKEIAPKSYDDYLTYRDQARYIISPFYLIVIQCINHKIL